MSVQQNTNTKSDAGPTENKLQRTSVGDQAEDGLSASGRKENMVSQGQVKETEQSKAVKRGRESTGTTASAAKRLNTTEYNAHNWPRFLFVESRQQDGSLARTSVFVISKAIQGSAGDVKSIKKTRAGTLLVEVDKRSHSTGLLNMTTLAGIPVRVSPHRSLNSSKGVIRSWDLVGTTEEEITDELSEIGVNDVKQMKFRKMGKVVETNTFVLTFDQPTPPKAVKCGYLNIKVEDYIPNPMRCYKCQKFGHTLNKCSSEETCGRCSRRGHSMEACQEAPHCTNCGGDHPSSSKNCPRFLEEKEVQTTRIKQRIPYMEAKKIVKSRNTKPSGPLFTEVAKCQCICTCRKQTGTNGRAPPPPVPGVPRPSEPQSPPPKAPRSDKDQAGNNGQTSPLPVATTPKPSGSQTPAAGAPTTTGPRPADAHPKASGSQSGNHTPSDSIPLSNKYSKSNVPFNFDPRSQGSLPENPPRSGSTEKPSEGKIGSFLAEMRATVESAETPSTSSKQAPSGPNTKNPGTASSAPSPPCTPAGRSRYSEKMASPPRPKDPPKRVHKELDRRFGKRSPENKTILGKKEPKGRGKTATRKITHINRNPLDINNRFNALLDEFGKNKAHTNV